MTTVWEKSVNDTLTMMGIPSAVWKSLAESASGSDPNYAKDGRYGIFGFTANDAVGVAPRDVNIGTWIQQPANSAKVFAAKVSKARSGAYGSAVRDVKATPEGIGLLAQVIQVGPPGILACAIDPSGAGCKAAVSSVRTTATAFLGQGTVELISDPAGTVSNAIKNVLASIPWARMGGSVIGVSLVIVGALGLVFMNKSVQGAAGGFLDGLTDEVPGGTTVKKTVKGARRK